MLLGLFALVGANVFTDPEAHARSIQGSSIATVFAVIAIFFVVNLVVYVAFAVA